MRILGAFMTLLILGACSDSDDKEFVLNRNDLTGKNWYYNGWIGNKLGYRTNDVLEVIRFDNNGNLIGVEYSGLKDTIAGKWRDLENNALRITDDSGEEKTWNVLGCGKGILSLHDGWGAREYNEGLSYLENLSGDAYWVNQYSSEEGTWKRTLEFKISGNGSIREAYAIVSDAEGGQIPLDRGSYLGSLVYRKNIDFTGNCDRVRFYCKIGSKWNVKFDESLYDSNVPEHAFDLRAEWKPTATSTGIDVTWTPVEESNIYYQVEVLDKNSDANNPFFKSEVLAGTGELNITEATQGKVENRLSSLVKGEVYKIRLSAILYEPGIGRYDNNADRNIQAISYVTKAFVWGE
ncbi:MULTISPECIES: hypothetical protein [Sanguibacteroides]|nr:MULTISPECIES: hypothetical protein [Sanguibacteroides]